MNARFDGQAQDLPVAEDIENPFSQADFLAYRLWRRDSDHISRIQQFCVKSRRARGGIVNGNFVDLRAAAVVQVGSKVRTFWVLLDDLVAVDPLNAEPVRGVVVFQSACCVLVGPSEELGHSLMAKSARALVVDPK